MKKRSKLIVLGLCALFNLTSCASIEKLKGAESITPQLVEMGCNPKDVHSIKNVKKSESQFFSGPPAWLIGCDQRQFLCVAEPETFNRDLVFHCQQKD